MHWLNKLSLYAEQRGSFMKISSSLASMISTLENANKINLVFTCEYVVQDFERVFFEKIIYFFLIDITYKPNKTVEYTGNDE